MYVDNTLVVCMLLLFLGWFGLLISVVVKFLGLENFPDIACTCFVTYACGVLCIVYFVFLKYTGAVQACRAYWGLRVQCLGNLFWSFNVKMSFSIVPKNCHSKIKIQIAIYGDGYFVLQSSKQVVVIVFGKIFDCKIIHSKWKCDWRLICLHIPGLCLNGT